MLKYRDHGLVYYCFEALDDQEGLFHGIFTRLGGVSSTPWATLNVGHTVGDDHEAVEENHARVCRVLDISGQDIVTGYQVHGTLVARVSREDRGQVYPETDILITDVPGVALMQRYADCLPILLYDPVNRAIGIAHAGWRGTLAGVTPKTVQAMQTAFGSRTIDLIAGLGPGIGPCCYQVGTEVADAAQAAIPGWPSVLLHQRDGSWHLDLWEANRRLLVQAGVERVEVSGLCTACRTDEFYSHRAESGRTGRFGVVVGLR
ncbi:MAG: peptidoglycan editing factor PgeF [Chloroflexota bacterium]|nr:peptidoglycan editing factor PgeF [Chloroflexota bacterium]